VGEPGSSTVPADTEVPGDFQTYRVRTGDTVNDIAREFGITQEALICANRALQRNPDRIAAGQQLNVPPKGWECPERNPRPTRRGARASEAPG
jgi:LysM repeat protein